MEAGSSLASTATSALPASIHSPRFPSISRAGGSSSHACRRDICAMDGGGLWYSHLERDREVSRELRCTRVASLAILGHRAREDVVDCGGELEAKLGRRARFFIADLLEQGRHRVGLERALAGEADVG